MKKFVMAALVLLAAGGGGYWWMNRPAFVQVQAVLTQGGEDVTDRMTWDVYRVLAETVGTGGTLTEVEGMAMNPDMPTLFEVPAGIEVIVEGDMRGLGEVSQPVTVAAGATEVVTLVLDAGIARVDVLQPEGVDDYYRVQLPFGTAISAYGLNEDGPTEFALRAGQHQIDLYGDEFAQSRMIEVVAGEIQDITFDQRLADVTVNLGTGGWPEDMPEIVTYLTLANGETVGPRLIHENGAATFADVPFGTHSVMAERRDGGSVTYYPLEAELVVDKVDAATTIPFEYVRMEVDVSAFGDTSDVSVFAIEVSSKGDRYSDVNLSGLTDAVLYLAPPPDYFAEFDYGVAVRNGDGFLSVVAIDKPAFGDTVQVSPVPSDGIVLCEKLYGDGYCDQMTP